MNVLEALSERLRQADIMQLLLGYFALLLIVAILSWPTSPQLANNSWFALVQAKIITLVLLSLYYGSALHSAPRHTQAATVLAILLFHALSLPFDVATYAVSFPATPVWWPPLITAVDIVAFFGMGVVLGQAMQLLRLSALLPLAPPALLAGLVAIDIWLGRSLFNPFTAVAVVTVPHLLVMGTLSLFIVGWVMIKTRKCAYAD